MTLTASIHEHIDWKDTSNIRHHGEDYEIFADSDKDNWPLIGEYLWYFKYYDTNRCHGKDYPDHSCQDCITKASLPWYEHLELTWMLGG